MSTFKIPDNSVKQNLSFWEKLQVQIDKYGLIGLFFFIMTVINGAILRNVTFVIQRTDKQSEANIRIGILEGQMQILIKDRSDALNYIKQLPTCTK